MSDERQIAARGIPPHDAAEAAAYPQSVAASPHAPASPATQVRGPSPGADACGGSHSARLVVSSLAPMPAAPTAPASATAPGRFAGGGAGTGTIGRVVALIRAAALRGEPCPTSAALADALAETGVTMTDVAAATALRGAAKVGLVVIERRGNARIVRAADGAWSTVALAAGDRRQRRPCMCCRKPFPSEGPHHRLCLVCAQKDTSPWE